MYRETDFDGLADAIGQLTAPASLAFRGNLGDALIRAGQLEIEDRSGKAVQQLATLGKGTKSVIIPGGGNLVEGFYNTAARALKSLPLDTPGIVLPHTVRGHYFALRRHPRLIITCRDRGSYDALVHAGIEPRRLLLCDDTAFALKGSDLLLTVAGQKPNADGTLVALRSDGESSFHNRSSSKLHARSFDVTGSASRHWTTGEEIRRGATSFLSYVNTFENVVTDRLHVAVAAHLLDRPCWLLPNSYNKNRMVFQYSMMEGSVTLVDSLDSVPGDVVEPADRTESRNRWIPFAVDTEELSPEERFRRRAALGRQRLRSALKKVF